MGEHPGPVAAMVKVIEPVGEAKSEYQIIADLAQRPAYHDNFYLPDGTSKFESPEKYISEDLTKLVMFGHDWNYLSEHVDVCRKTEYRKYERGLLRQDGQPGFNTTTGKIELYSLMFASCGGDPLPYYEEPRFSDRAKPEWAEEYPLTLTTGARNWASFHSEHRQVKMLREIKPYPVVEIHPNLAKKLDIIEGEWVAIENPWGKCYEKAKLSARLKEYVVHADHGWWYPEEDMSEPSLGGVWVSNINELVPNNEIGFYGFGALYKSLPCKISKAEMAPLKEHLAQDLPDSQNYPGSIKNDPELKELVR
jgi:anaerobic selenocysteine-containing dehydrogenase